MSVALEGLAPGSYGAHIHDVGSCTPDLMAAGPHWAPFDAALNLADEDEANDSDYAKIAVGEDGKGSVTYILDDGVSLDAIMAGDGSSFMIHNPAEGSDIEPAESNGDRIACGVF